MKNASQNNLLIALVLIVIGAVIVAFMLTKDSGPADDDVVDAQNDATAQNFICIASEEWSYYEDASNDIQELTPDQVIGKGIVNDPNEEEFAYFIAEAPNTEEETVLLSVYKYNTGNYTFERIYRKTFSTIAREKEQDFYFSLIGYDAGKLAIMKTSTLLNGPDDEENVNELFSINLSDPFAAGLTPYEIPQDAPGDKDACISSAF